MNNTNLLILTLSAAIVGLLVYKYMEGQLTVQRARAAQNMDQREGYALSDIANTYRHSVTGVFDKINTRGLIAGDIHGGVAGMSGKALQFSDSSTMRNRGGVFDNIRDSAGNILDVGQNFHIQGDDRRNIEGYIMMDHVSNPEPRYEQLKGWY